MSTSKREGAGERSSGADAFADTEDFVTFTIADQRKRPARSIAAIFATTIDRCYRGSRPRGIFVRTMEGWWAASYVILWCLVIALVILFYLNWWLTVVTITVLGVDSLEIRFEDFTTGSFVEFF